MRRGQQRFKTPEEAKAFLAGIAYVNDDAVAAWLAPEDPRRVLIEDRSYEQENDEPWPKRLRPPTNNP